MSEELPRGKLPRRVFPRGNSPVLFSQIIFSDNFFSLLNCHQRGSLNYFKLGGLKIPTKHFLFNPLMHGGNKRS